jgi:hypothetical protein
MRYEVLLNDGSVEVIDNVDGYAPDGCLTTFFTVEDGRAVRLDPWAIRVMSLRSDRVVRIARSWQANQQSPENQEDPELVPAA